MPAVLIYIRVSAVELIISRLTYHQPYHNLTPTETNQMDTLLRTAIKAALGLPQHASTQLLLRLQVSNEQLAGVSHSIPSRILNTKKATTGRPHTSRAYSIRNKLHVAPIPRNMHPDRHECRRPARAQGLARIFGDDSSDTHTGPLHRRGPVPTKTCCVSSRTR